MLSACGFKLGIWFGYRNSTVGFADFMLSASKGRGNPTYPLYFEQFWSWLRELKKLLPDLLFLFAGSDKKDIGDVIDTFYTIFVKKKK